ncbi:MAG TPA: hypothetical protein VMW87_05120 [Spirochaetia bacterium]|nr:hypothetical protein [Spirochaetia bacterium]
MNGNMPSMVVLVLVIAALVTPAGVIAALRRMSLPITGAVAVCYLLGIVAGNVAPLAAPIRDMQETLAGLLVAFWIPLLILPLRIGEIGRIVARAVTTAVVVLFSLTITVVAVHLVFHAFRADNFRVTAIEAAFYSGGIPGADALRRGQHLASQLVAQVQSVGTVLTAPFLFVSFLLGPKLSGSARAGAVAETEAGPLPQIKGLLPILAVAALIAGLGLAVGSLFPAGLSSILGMATIGLLSVATTLVRRLQLRPAPAVWEVTAGQYAAVTFAFVAGSMTGFRGVISAAGTVWITAAAVLFGAAGISLLISRAANIADAPAVVISILASAPFAGPASVAIGRPRAAVGGLSAGILGYALGSLLGRALLGLLPLLPG